MAAWQDGIVMDQDTLYALVGRVTVDGGIARSRVIDIEGRLSRHRNEPDVATPVNDTSLSQGVPVIEIDGVSVWDVAGVRRDQVRPALSTDFDDRGQVIPRVATAPDPSFVVLTPWDLGLGYPVSADTTPRTRTIDDERRTAPPERPKPPPPEEDNPCTCELKCAPAPPLPEVPEDEGCYVALGDHRAHFTLALKSPRRRDPERVIIWAETLNGLPTDSIMFVEGHEPIDQELGGWTDRLVGPMLPCPYPSYRFKAKGLRAGRYIVKANWDGIECSTPLNVLDCKCRGLTCKLYNKNLRVSRAQLESAARKNCVDGQCLIAMSKGRFEDQLDKANLLGCAFTVELKGVDRQQHAVVYEIEPIAGQPVDLVAIRWVADERPTAPNKQVSKSFRGCDEDLWCTVDILQYTEAEADAENARRQRPEESESTPSEWSGPDGERVKKGEVKRGDCWIVAKYDGVECERRLIRVYFDTPLCSLIDADTEAREKQQKALQTIATPTLSKCGSEKLAGPVYLAMLRQANDDGTKAFEISFADVHSFLNVDCDIGAIEVATHFAPNDCCCKYIKSMAVSLKCTMYFTGAASNPLAEVPQQLNKLLSSDAFKSAFKDDILQAADAARPKCRRMKPERACIDWVPDTHVIRQVLRDVLCASIMDKVRALTLPGVATGPSGQPLPRDPGTWEPSVATDLATRCEALHHLDILTLRVKVYTCTTKTGAALQQWLAECVAALQGANALFLKCCIRLHPEDMDPNKFGILQNKVSDYCGAPREPDAGYRTSLVLADDEDAGNGTFVGSHKQKGHLGGFADCPSPRGYAKRCAVWAISARLIAHEIGHNAGLACDRGPDESLDGHRHHRSDRHIMGSSAGDQAAIDANLRDSGLEWEPIDCAQLRRFVLNRPPLEGL